jgi:hypothetical protein
LLDKMPKTAFRVCEVFHVRIWGLCASRKRFSVKNTPSKLHAKSWFRSQPVDTVINGTKDSKKKSDAVLWIQLFVYPAKTHREQWGGKSERVRVW